MKKSLLLVGAAVAAVTFMTGCTSLNTNDAAVGVPVVIEKKMTAEITCQPKKVSGEAKVNTLFGFISWGVSEYADDAFIMTSNSSVSFASGTTVAKQGATYKACKASNADYILGAKYTIDTKDYFVFKTVKCKVSGFPANIKGIK